MKTASFAVFLSLALLATVLILRGNEDARARLKPVTSRIQHLCTACVSATRQTAAAFQSGLRGLRQSPDTAPVTVDPPFQTQPAAPSPDHDEPATRSPEERQRIYRELIAAAEARKKELLRALVRECPEGRAALEATQKLRRATRRYRELEQQYGQTDERTETVYYEIIRLRETVREANARYQAWKKEHPGKTYNPEDDADYRALIERSRLYQD